MKSLLQLKLRIKFVYLVFIIFGRCRQTSMKRKSHRIRDKVHLIVHTLEVCQSKWYQCEVKNLLKHISHLLINIEIFCRKKMFHERCQFVEEVVYIRFTGDCPLYCVIWHYFIVSIIKIAKHLAATGYRNPSNTLSMSLFSHLGIADIILKYQNSIKYQKSSWVKF